MVGPLRAGKQDDKGIDETPQISQNGRGWLGVAAMPEMPRNSIQAVKERTINWPEPGQRRLQSLNVGVQALSEGR
jgi:hypothetical protein